MEGVRTPQILTLTGTFKLSGVRFLAVFGARPGVTLCQSWAKSLSQCNNWRCQAVSRASLRRDSVHGEARPVVHDACALELPFEPVGLLAQFARLAGTFPRRPAPFALAEPGRDPADDEAESERAKQEEEERRLKRVAPLASPERIENEGGFRPIDDGKRDQHKRKRHEDKGKDE